MAKRFFDVFPSLQVEGDMKNLLTETAKIRFYIMNLMSAIICASI